MIRLNDFFYKFFLSFIVIFSVGGILSAAPVSEISQYRFYFKYQKQTLQIPYYRNSPLGGNKNYNRTRAIVAIHGAARDAYFYHDIIMGLPIDAKTLVISPQFLVKEDVDAFGLSNKNVYWTPDYWKNGHKSESFPRVSSFLILDQILLSLKRLNPNLKQIVIVGHSAGGQFVNRYAAGNQVEQQLRGTKIRYIISNPSTYMYFDNKRFYDPSKCTGYNTYKYGLAGVENHSYMSKAGAVNIQKQYKEREVIYLLGGDDTVADSNFENSCKDQVQGENRLQRGILYFSHTIIHFGIRPSNHRFVIVPGIGHSPSLLYPSECGKKFILDIGSCSYEY